MPANISITLWPIWVFLPCSHSITYIIVDYTEFFSFDFNNYEMFTVFYIEVLRPLASVNVAIPSQNFKFFFHIPSFRTRYNGSILRNMSANKYSVCSLFL